MRVTVTIALAYLTLGLASRPMLAQIHDNAPALVSIHLIDALVGWGVTREQEGIPASPSNALVRTTDGGTRWKDVTPPFGPHQNRFYFNATSVNVFTSVFAWVGPFRTKDGGRTWKCIPTPGVYTVDPFH